MDTVFCVMDGNKSLEGVFRTWFSAQDWIDKSGGKGWTITEHIVYDEGW